MLSQAQRREALSAHGPIRAVRQQELHHLGVAILCRHDQLKAAAAWLHLVDLSD